MTITVSTFFFVFSELKLEMIACFVDFGGIDGHYCLNFHQYQYNKQSPLILTH
jgi:hypothetical protein